MAIDYISGAEFSRFRADHSAWQDRLMNQLNDGFRGVHNRLDELSGRTRTNSESLARFEGEMDGIRPLIEDIKAHGCSQLSKHAAIVRTMNGANGDDGAPGPAGWGRQKKVLVGGGIAAGGAATWPLVQLVLSELHKFFTQLPR